MAPRYWHALEPHQRTPREWLAKSSYPNTTPAQRREQRNGTTRAAGTIASWSVNHLITIYVADVAAELLFIWHQHRLPILLAALVVATVVRLAIYSRDRREKLSLSPAPSSPVPVEEKPTVQLKPEWLPEYTTLNSSELNVDNHAEDDTMAVAAAAKVKKGPKMVKGRKTPKKLVAPATFNHQTDKIQPLVFFQSLSGTTERYAKQFAGVLTEWTR